MKKISLILFSFLFFLSAGKAQTSDILLTVGNEKVTAEEFKFIYQKNNTDELGQKSPEEYLDLFTDFKLFVVEAKALKMDTSRQFKNELEGYRQNLAEPYLTETEVYESYLRQAYENSKTDVKFDLIFIKNGIKATREQSEKARKKAKKIRERIINGEDFYKVARETSDQKSVARNSGQYSFTSLSVLPAGVRRYLSQASAKKVSHAIASPFGFYIVRLQDKRPNPGSVQVAHILLLTEAEANEQSIARQEEKADSIWRQLKKGEPFEELARKHSQDKVSAKKGGAMRPFSTGRMVPSFEQAAFALEEIGDFSEPVRTRVGFHIIKLLDKIPPKSFDEAKTKLKKQIDRDPQRRNEIIDKTTEKLKDKYDYKEIYTDYSRIKEQTDSSIFAAQWEFTPIPEYENEVMFTAGQKEYTLNDFGEFLQINSQKQQPADMDNYLKNKFDLFVYKMLSEAETNDLKNNRPEYANIIREYYDGMLLFEYKNHYIWEKAAEDSVALRKFYRKNKKLFQAKPLTDLSIFEYQDEKQAEKFLRLAERGFDGMSNEDILENTERRNQRLKLVAGGEFEQGENIYADKVFEIFEEIPAFKEQDVLHLAADNLVVYIRGRRKSPIKPFEEIKGTVISEYQKHLEKEKLKELKKKYRISINEDVFNRLKSEL